MPGGVTLTNRYLQSAARFGGTLLAGGILLKLLAGSFPAVVTSAVGSHYQVSLGALVADALRSAAAISGRALIIALPLAMFAGIPAGLMPAGRIARVLLTPAALLAGIPALPGVLLLVTVLTALPGWGVSPSLYLALGLAVWPWLTLAVRDAVGSIVTEGAGVHPARALTAVVGAVLSQAGNLAVAALAAGAYLVPDTGALRLLELGSRMSDPVLLYTFLAVAVPLVAVLHLAGNSLTAFAAGPGRRPERLPRSWAAAGALLLATSALACFGDMAAGARLSWEITLGATAVAAALGFALALTGPLCPGPGLPSLIAPIITGMAVPVIYGRSPLTQAIAIGIACAPTLAGPVRRAFAAAPGAPALAGAAGAFLLAAAQALGAHLTLGIMNVGLAPDAVTLGSIVRTSLLGDGVTYGPVLLVLAAVSGLTLLGFAGTERAGDEVVAGPLAAAPEHEVPVEPAVNEEPAQQSAGAD